MNEFMNVSEAAQRLGVSQKTIRKMLNGGRLHGSLFGAGRGTWRVSTPHLEELTRMKRYHCGTIMDLGEDGGTWTCSVCGETREQ